jgi:phage anti-repressor protein/phage antirepressor YoqD-like protein
MTKMRVKMNEIIKIEKKTIGNEKVNAVDGRELHKFLEVKSEFRNWIKNRINGYDFVQGIDFIAGNFLPGSDQKDYYIAIDMAKELAMVERNEKGKQARQYFIEMERKAKELEKNITLPNFTNPAEAARAWALEYEQKQLAIAERNELKAEAKENEPAVSFANAVRGAMNSVSLRDFWNSLKSEYGLQYGETKMNDFLVTGKIIYAGRDCRCQKILYRIGKKLRPYAKFTASGKGWLTLEPASNSNSRYGGRVYTQTRVTGKGMVELGAYVLKKLNIDPEIAKREQGKKQLELFYQKVEKQ